MSIFSRMPLERSSSIGAGSLGTRKLRNKASFSQSAFVYATFDTPGIAPGSAALGNHLKSAMKSTRERAQRSPTTYVKTACCSAYVVDEYPFVRTMADSRTSPRLNRSYVVPSVE